METQNFDDIHTKKIMDISINDALEALSLAVKEKKEELETLLHTKYANLKDIILEGEMSTLWVMKEGQESVKNMAGRIDKVVREKPWAFVAGALIIGLLLGRKK